MSHTLDNDSLHRLKNQLSIVLGFCELLLDSMPPDDARRADVLEIQKAGVSALALLPEEQ